MAKDDKGLQCVERFEGFIFEGRYPVIVSFSTHHLCPQRLRVLWLWVFIAQTPAGCCSSAAQTPQSCHWILKEIQDEVSKWSSRHKDLRPLNGNQTMDRAGSLNAFPPSPVATWHLLQLFPQSTNTAGLWPRFNHWKIDRWQSNLRPSSQPNPPPLPARPSANSDSVGGQNWPAA